MAVGRFKATTKKQQLSCIQPLLLLLLLLLTSSSCRSSQPRNGIAAHRPYGEVAESVSRNGAMRLCSLVLALLRAPLSEARDPATLSLSNVDAALVQRQSDTAPNRPMQQDRPRMVDLPRDP